MWGMEFILQNWTFIKYIISDGMNLIFQLSLNIGLWIIKGISKFCTFAPLGTDGFLLDASIWLFSDDHWIFNLLEILKCGSIRFDMFNHFSILSNHFSILRQKKRNHWGERERLISICAKKWKILQMQFHIIKLPFSGGGFITSLDYGRHAHCYCHQWPHGKLLKHFKILT